MLKISGKCCRHLHFTSIAIMEVILVAYIPFFILSHNIIPHCVISHATQTHYAASFGTFFGNLSYSFGELVVVLCLLGFFTNQVCTACKKTKCCK